VLELPTSRAMLATARLLFEQVNGSNMRNMRK